MVESLDVKPHLRDLLLNHAIMATYEAGDQVLVPQGTAIKEVSVSHMRAERAVLEVGEMRRPSKVWEQLTKMCEQCCADQRKQEIMWKGKGKATSSRALQFVRDGIQGLFRQLETLDNGDAADAMHASGGDLVEPPTPE